MQSLPSSGFVRLAQIIGQKAITTEQANANRSSGRRGRRSRAAVTGVIPISASTWWRGVASGRYPTPIKCGRSTLWRVEDVKALIEQITQEGGL